MGGKLSKKMQNLNCSRSSSSIATTSSYSHSSYCQQNAAMVWSNFLQSRNLGDDQGQLQLTEMMIDGSFMECLLELSKQAHATRQPQTKGLIQSLVFDDCYFNLSDQRTLAAMTEFVSLNQLKTFEFWDGEVPISQASLTTLLHVLAESAASSLVRLRLNAALQGRQSGQYLALVLQQCSQLSHLELVGCALDLCCIKQLSQGFQSSYDYRNQFCPASRITQFVLDSCQLEDQMLESLLDGLVECPDLQNVVITGNDGLTNASLAPLTVFLRRHRQKHQQQRWPRHRGTTSNQGLQQISLHTNRNLFTNCTFQEARQFFSAYLEQQQNAAFSSSPSSNGELFLCQMGIDNTAVACLFQILLENSRSNHAIERLDLRFNNFDSSRSSPSSPSWVDSLPQLQHLKTLLLPSNLQSCAELHHALLRNTSLITTDFDNNDNSSNIDKRDMTMFPNDTTTKAKILNRNKILDLVQDVLASSLPLSWYPDIMAMVDSSWQRQQYYNDDYYYDDRTDNGDNNDEPPTALFRLIKGKSTELADTFRMAEF